MRADIAEVTAHGKRLIENGEGDAQFIAAQREFDEARLQFLLAAMRAENAGIGRNELLSGAGYTLGQVWASMLQSCVGVRERSVLNGWIHQALAQTIGAEATKKTLESVFKSEEVGHA